VTKPLFQQFAESQKAIERLTAAGELHQQIDIAVRPRSPSEYRAKQRKAFNAKRPNLRLGRPEPFHGLFSR